MTRIGVVGAGRVGAVLAAALHASGHEIVAVAGESDASLGRADSLLPGVPVRKPSEVARACDVLLLTVPDDMLGNVSAMLAASGAIREGQYVAHTSGKHGLAVLSDAVAVGARPVALHPAMTFTGTELDLPRLAGCVYGVTAGSAESALAEQLVADLGGRIRWVPEDDRALYHAALAHGANHLVTLVSEALEMLAAVGGSTASDSTDSDCNDSDSAAPSDADTLRPLLQAALDNALSQGDAALTGPIVRGDVNTVADHLEDLLRRAPHTVPSYLAMARATLDRVLTDGRLLPIRAGRLAAVLDEAEQRLHAATSESVRHAQQQEPLR